MTVNTDPSAILKTALGFWESKVLLTAVGLGLFTKLGFAKVADSKGGKRIVMTRN